MGASYEEREWIGGSPAKVEELGLKEEWRRLER
jgi:hypothetical protein